MKKFKNIKNYNLKKFIIWVQKKYNSSDPLLCFYLFYCINNKKFKTKIKYSDLYKQWLKTDFWNHLNNNINNDYKCDAETMFNEIFNELISTLIVFNDDKFKLIKNNLWHYFCYFCNLFNDFRSAGILIDTQQLDSYFKWAVSFSFYYFLFEKQKDYLDSLSNEKKIEINLYLKNIYTYNMQIIFKNDFNDLYLLSNKVLIWE